MRASELAWRALAVAHRAAAVLLFLFFTAHLLLTLEPARAHGWVVSTARLFCPLHPHR